MRLDVKVRGGAIILYSDSVEQDPRSLQKHLEVNG